VGTVIEVILSRFALFASLFIGVIWKQFAPLKLHLYWFVNN